MQGLIVRRGGSILYFKDGRGTAHWRCPKSGEGIDYLYKREAMKIGIAGVDLPNSVLAHEHYGMCIMENVAAQMWYLGNRFGQGNGMLRCWKQEAGAWTIENYF